ncbi:MAG TPA: TlpA disulfide reductase family protein [Bryobacteraceae bacterium]|jgi:thiol-disulfide isomerase/thioredoxin|nr:TlpA disulfide reductase family protein [Bryobacteraceae bacterium]
MRIVSTIAVTIALSCSTLPAIVPEVRALLRNGDSSGADKLLDAHKAKQGLDGEYLEAFSWKARDALARKDYAQAEKLAAETRKQAIALLKKRNLDAEPHLPVALGAAIEVQAQAAAARGERDQAVMYLRDELKRYYNTSIRTRIQKNINLLSLEGKPAPELETKQWLGTKPGTLASYRGKPVLLFFWAHWCSDCKRQMPLIHQVRKEYASKGLVVIGPTQHYGYAERGREVSPEEELKYIDSVRQGFYAPLSDMPVPVSEENFRRYGASTTPTLVLVNRKGMVTTYNPGNLTIDDLRNAINKAL